MVVVQEVTLWWTKKSRSAPGSTVRNAVPELFEVPFRPATMNRTGVAYHGVLIQEWLGFGQIEQTVDELACPDTEPVKLGCLYIRPREEVTEVVYAYDFDCGGAPVRTPLPRVVLTLRPGQWGRAVYNGRFEDWKTREWLYKKVVANVAHVQDTEEQVFSGAPSKSFADLALLR